MGLLMVRHKILTRKNVRGISGTCMSMFLIPYVFRCYELFPEFSMAYIHHWVLFILCFVSLIQVLDIIVAVFVTYRSTYQDDLDVLKIKHVFPGIIIASLLF